MRRPTLVAASAALLLMLLPFSLRPVAASGTADLGVRMSVDPSIASVGQTVTFTMVAVNRGPNTSSMDVHEMPPSTVTITRVDCGPAGPSPDGPFCEYSLVAPGTSRTMTMTATINSGARGTVLNTACVASEGDTTDPSPGNNCSGQKVKVQ